MLRIFGWVAAVVVVRLLLVSQVELGDDEAYYWLWSQRPDLAYFDHGGGVAWLIRASTDLLGDSPLAVRAPTVVAGGALALLLAWGSRAEDRALVAALALFVPVFGLVGVFAAPDAPLLLVWVAGALAAERLEDDPRPLRWAAVGACVGLSMLFKLTGALLGAGLVLWSWSAPSRRGWWRTSGPWLAVGIAVGVSAPTWAWNLLHDLPTLRFHAVERHQHPPVPWTGAATWAAVHAVLLTPPVMWGIWRAWRAGHRRTLVWVAAPTWGVFTVAAVLTATKLHWWAPAWITVLPLAAVGLRRSRGWAWGTVAVGAAVHLFVLGAAAVPVGPLATWTAELRGWEDLAERLQDEPAQAWVTPRYQSSAQLAWGARDIDAPPILRVTGRRDQFTIWGDDQLPTEGPVLLVCASHLPCTPADVPGLVCPEPERRRPVHHADGRVVRTFSVWRCTPTE